MKAQQQTQKNVKKEVKNIPKTDTEVHIAEYLHRLTFVKCSNIGFWFMWNNRWILFFMFN